MIQLIYRSIADAELTENDLKSILSKARRYNYNMGITGCLLYCRGDFVQILEGDKQKVSGLFQKIKTDIRHHDVTEVLMRKSDQRIFRNWSMAFKNLDQRDILEVQRGLDQHDFKGLGELMTQSNRLSPLILFNGLVKSLFKE